MAASEDAMRLQRELAHARTMALSSGMGVKTQLQGLQIGYALICHYSRLRPNTYNSYREQVEKISRLKEETVRNIIKNSHDIAIFKEEVSQHLRDLREFVEAG
jgi:kinetochore protein NDC80